MFARLDFSTFLVYCSGYLSDNESEEKPSVAICGGSICILTGLVGLLYRKESPGKEVEVVWACDEKRGASRRKEGDGNESTREKEERKT